MNKNPTHTAKALIEWVRGGLNKPGKKQKYLALELCIDNAGVSKILSGIRQIYAYELPVISAYIEEPIPVALLNSFPLTLSSIAPEDQEMANLLIRLSSPRKRVLRDMALLLVEEGKEKAEEPEPTPEK